MDEELPSRFSWRDSGIMSSVKHQQTCGSCWAHSTLGVFEALIMKSDGVEVDLSEQQLVNCFANTRKTPSCSVWVSDSRAETTLIQPPPQNIPPV